MAIRTLEQVFVWPVDSMLHGWLNCLFGLVHPRYNAEATGKTEFVHHQPLAQGVFQSYQKMNSKGFPLNLGNSGLGKNILS